MSWRSSGNDVDPDHHGVVLVDGVVAVHGVAAEPVAEPDVELHLVPGIERENVLAALEDAAVDGAAVVGEDPVLLHVDVHGVRPSARSADAPDLGRAALEDDVGAVVVEDVAVEAIKGVPKIVAPTEL